MQPFFVSFLIIIAVFLILHVRSASSQHYDDFNTIELTEEELLLAEHERVLKEEHGLPQRVESMVQVDASDAQTPLQHIEDIDNVDNGRPLSSAPLPEVIADFVSIKDDHAAEVADPMQAAVEAVEEAVPFAVLKEEASAASQNDEPNPNPTSSPEAAAAAEEAVTLHSMEKKHAELQVLYEDALRLISSLQLKEKLLRNDINVLQLKHDNCNLNIEAIKMDSGERIAKCEKGLKKVKDDFSYYFEEADKVKEVPRTDNVQSDTTRGPKTTHYTDDSKKKTFSPFFESVKSQFTSERMTAVIAHALEAIQQFVLVSAKIYETLFSVYKTIVMPYVIKAFGFFCKYIVVCVEQYIIPFAKSVTSDFLKPFYVRYLNDYVVMAVNALASYYDTYAAKYVNRYHNEILAVIKEHHIDLIFAEYLAPHVSYWRENITSALYFVGSYYNADDVHVRLLKLVTDTYVKAVQYHEAAANIVARLITVSEMVDEKYASVLGRIAIYLTSGLFMFLIRKIILGLSAFVLMIVLSPLLLVVFVLSKILGLCFGRKKKKNVKKYKNLNSNQQQQQQRQQPQSQQQQQTAALAPPPNSNPNMYNSAYNTNYRIPDPQSNQPPLGGNDYTQSYTGSYANGGNYSRAPTDTPRAGTGFNSI